MNGIDDLRRTLDEHAVDLVDHGVPGRAAEVHRRVGAVRRRRRRALAGAAAAVVAVGAGVALLPDGAGGPDPARTVVGVPAPAELTALGYRYAFTEAVEGEDGRAVVKLKPSAEPRLVAWATSTKDQGVTVQTDSERVLSYDVPDFGDWVAIPAGISQKVTVRSEDGEAGLAVYTLTSDRPAGVTKNGITFRDEVDGQPLLGAAIGDAGAASVTAELSGSAPALDLRYFCAGAPDNAYVHTALGRGDLGWSQGCDAVVPADPASYDATVLETPPGADGTARIYVTRGENGPLVDDPDLRIGIGVYAAQAPPEGEQATFPTMIEENGQLWRLAERHSSAPGQDRVAAPVMGGDSPVLVVAGVNAERVDVLADFGGEEEAFANGPDVRGTTFTPTLVSPGRVVTLRLGSVMGDDPGTLGPEDSLELAFYERAD